jgi:hypothetical protein
MSPEFICRYIDWRKSRLAMRPSIRKRDRGWYAWNQWFLDGIVKNEMVPSMRTLAHIYDSAKPGSPITGCALNANTHAPLQRQQLESIKTKIISWYLALLAKFSPQALQLRYRRPARQSEDPRETSRCLQPDRCSRGPPCCLRSSPRHIGRGLSPECRRGGGNGCPC